MFDLISYIRQNLPPHLRTALNVGLINVLYAPMASLLLAIAQTRSRMLYDARANGQVAVLEELCNSAVFGDAIGTIYLLDSNASTVDFQVVIPGGMPEAQKSVLRGILDTNKQAGKRYEFVEDLTWTVPPVVNPNPQPDGLAFEPGYPFLNDQQQFVIAINKTGTYEITYKEDGTDVYGPSLLVAFTAGQGMALYAPSPTATYAFTMGYLSASLSRSVATVGTIARVAFLRYQNTLFLGAQIDTGTVEMKLVGVDGTSYQDSYIDGENFGISITGQDYNRRRYFPAIPEGKYRAFFRVKGQTKEQALDINLTTANQLPYVQNPVQDRVGKVGTTFVYQVANDTFADRDGSIAGVTGTGWPTGVSYDPNTRQASGTPTTVGTYTVTLTATDNKGGQVQDQFTVTIQAADVVNPTPPVTTDAGEFMPETFAGTLVMAEGWDSTNKDILNIRLKSWNPQTKRYKVENIAPNIKGDIGRDPYYEENERQIGVGQGALDNCEFVAGRIYHFWYFNPFATQFAYPDDYKKDPCQRASVAFYLI